MSTPPSLGSGAFGRSLLGLWNEKRFVGERAELEPNVSTGRSELPSLFEEIGEPEMEVFGAAVLCASPDLSEIIAV
jgi:hypothetical protein